MLQVSQSLADTEVAAREFLGTLQPAPMATIVALEGDLGAGKTAFTKIIAKLLGVEEQVSSPTFVIEKVYALQNQIFTYLIHIDAYRLENPQELETLGWQKIIADPGNLILIEWPEKAGHLIPSQARRIKFTFIDEQTRTIEVIN
jgi:tRNA threonylcarbamoyladenosine biosynthesis protein TsaE